MRMAKPISEKMRCLTDCVEAYEQSIADGLDCAIESCLPDEAHPDYPEIVIELVRVEMERKGWQRHSSITHYSARFPGVFADPARKALIAFEEFRVRRQHGEAVSRREYADKFRIDTTCWPSVASNQDAHVASSVTSGVERRRLLFPPVIDMEPGQLRQCIAEAFPEFEPVEELGKGAFGRVFLARQRNLADRLVVIKVTSDTTSEPERLARLQHTNIVPVYSVHRTAEWQAICMPFFGRKTLRDVMGGSGHGLGAGCPCSEPVQGGATNATAVPASPGWIETSLRLMEQVAAGLEHAHRSGILHRDVKPANILVTAEGQPMLLDFNLSSDVVAQSLSRSIVGGTIPYLAPEQLESLQTGSAVSVTADIYSLGVILFEFLTGRLPFQPAQSASLSSLILDAKSRKSSEIPRIRDFNPRVTIAVQAIVSKCLQPNPANRYQSAAELGKDLRCELNDLPLQHVPNSSLAERVTKWRRRHPHLLSVTSLLFALMIVVAVAGVRWIMVQERMATLQAQSQWQSFRESAPAVRTLLSSPDSSANALEEGLKSARTLVDRYHVGTASDWHHTSDYQQITREQRRLLDEELAEIVFLMSSARHRQARLTVDETERKTLLGEALQWNSLASQFDSAAGSQHAWLLQRTGINASQGQKSASPQPAAELISADSGQLTGFANAIQLLETGDAHEAQELLLNLVQQNPHDYSAWYLLGKARQICGLNWEADGAFSTCIALNSDCWLAWQDRGIVRLTLRRFREAAEDCSRLIALRPDLAAGNLNRALAEIALGQLASAEQDLDAAIAHGGPARAWFLRADIRRRQGNSSGARSDFETGIMTVPDDEDSWVARGMAVLQQDPQRALADFDQALRLNHRSRDALQNSAHVLSERLGRPDEAIFRLETLLACYPDDNAARAGRAVLYARGGQDDAARSDAAKVLEQSPNPVTVYQVACVFALLSQRTTADAETALRHLSEAMRIEPQLYAMAEQDSDLNPVRSQATFHNLLTACRSLLNPAADISQTEGLSPNVNDLNKE